MARFRRRPQRITLSRNVAYALDPTLLAQRCGLQLDTWQADLLLNDAAMRIILNCARQSGKSTVVALMALHHALYSDNAMVIIISHTLHQAAETFKKISRFNRRIGRPVTSVTETVKRLELQNGSRIVTLSGQKPESIRGYSGVTMLIIDEAAQVPDETYFAARPMLAVSGGRIVLLSTPHGKQGFFYEAWESEDEWLKVEINADQCPRITSEFLAEERRNYPSWFFQQEYYCEFRNTTTSLFDSDTIEGAFVNRPGRTFDF